MTRTTRCIVPTLALVLASPLIVSCSSSAGSGASNPDASRPQATATILTTRVPDTVVGNQLRWFLAATAHLPLTNQQVAEHFAQVVTFGITGVGQQAPRDQLNLLLAAPVPRGGFRLLGLTNVEPASLEAVASNGSDQWRITVGVDPQGEIDRVSVDGVFWSRPPPPTSWAQLDQRLDALAPQASFLAAQVSSGGQCRTIHAVAPDVPRPLASMFKLYVLGAVGTQIARGQLAWNQPVAIQENLKSLPTPSPFNQLPAGATVPVQQLARSMVSASDNTAADQLIGLVGRGAVEGQLQQWSSHAGLNIPLLTTREVSILRSVDYPHLANHYLALDASQRASYLRDVVDRVPLDSLHPVADPQDASSLEWFGSAADICSAFAGLQGQAANSTLAPIDSVMAARGTVGLDPSSWPRVWYKEGSDFGALTASYLATDNSGRTFVVTVLVSNPHRSLDLFADDPKLASIIEAAFSLASGSTA